MQGFEPKIKHGVFIRNNLKHHCTVVWMWCANRYEKPHRYIQWGFSNANNKDGLACILVSTNAQKTCVSLHRKAVADDACASSGLAHRAKLSPINGLHQPFHLPILSMSHPFCRVRIRRFPNLERWCIYHSRKSQGNHTWCLLECHSRRLMERPW